MLQKPRANADAQSDADLLAHIVHANSCGHILLRRALVQADELCREGYATKETEWEGSEDFLPDSYEFHAYVSFHSCLAMQKNSEMRESFL